MQLRHPIFFFTRDEAQIKVDYDHDAQHIFRRLGDIIGRDVPQLAVSYYDLEIETDASLSGGSRASLIGTLKKLGRKAVCLQPVPTAPLTILHKCSGVLQPGTLTLLLGPPGSGKSIFLSALAGRSTTSKSLGKRGIIAYNGRRLNELEPRRTIGLVNQSDAHIANLTVLETIEFASACQLTDIDRALIIARINKALNGTDASEERLGDILKETVSASGRPGLILKLVGLNHVAHSMVGDMLRRGISGGERKRLTSAEILVGPQNAIFMDEISTGLDSATCFAVIAMLGDVAHGLRKTIAVNLLAPPPEVINLFDDLILQVEGRIIYHGPIQQALHYFQTLGFECPPRKDLGGFFVELATPLGQLAYATPDLLTTRDIRAGHTNLIITIQELDEIFNESSYGKSLKQAANTLCQGEVLGASPCYRQLKSGQPITKQIQILLRRAFKVTWRVRTLLYIRVVQATIMGVVVGTLVRPSLVTVDTSSVNGWRNVLGLGVIANIFISIVTLSHGASMFASKVVFFKQRDGAFFFASSFSIASFIAILPQLLAESVMFSSVTYWVSGLTASAARFFLFLATIFSASVTFTGMYQLVAALSPSGVVSNVASNALYSFVVLFNGFFIPYPSIADFLVWIYWMNPASWVVRSLGINELSAPRWGAYGIQGMQSLGFHTSDVWIDASFGFYWGAAALYILLTSITLHFIEKPSPRAETTLEMLERAVIIEEHVAFQFQKVQSTKAGACEKQDLLARNAVFNSISKTVRTIVPFEPVMLVVKDLNYFVGVLNEGRPWGESSTKFADRDVQTQGKLQLLQNVSFFAHPGRILAIMGGSGAGKTTLMDCVAGRKRHGVLRGEILLNGHSRDQSIWARVAGYVQQHDTNSSSLTIHECLRFSARLRLPPSFSDDRVNAVVGNVEEMLQLGAIRDRVVGIVGAGGLSAEQSKRLSIGVEIVSERSLMFLDEPTSSLDSAAAVKIARALKTVATSGRTVIVVIHQPSVDVFESCDDILLLKRGGHTIYFGELGPLDSSTMVSYFQSIPGVVPIEANQNPASWMLEVSGAVTFSQGKTSDVDFAEEYKRKLLPLNAKRMADLLNGFRDSQNLPSSAMTAPLTLQFQQLAKKFTVLYWRLPEYTLVRIMTTIAAALLYSLLFLNVGKISRTSDGVVSFGSIQSLMGVLFSAIIFNGKLNQASISPVIAAERQVLYRERASAMYSPQIWAFGIDIAELPYCFVQTITLSCITYFACGFQLVAWKMLYFLLIFFLSYAIYTQLGILTTLATPNHMFAQLFAGTAIQLWAYFGGYFFSLSSIPSYWRWLYYVSPTAYGLYGAACCQLCDNYAIVEGSTKTVSQTMKDTFGFEFSFIWWCPLILSGYWVAMRLLVSIVLEYVNYERR